MSTAQYWQTNSVTTLMSTELNSLASSTTAGAISSVGGSSGVFNNAYSGGGLGGYPLGDLELVLGAPGGTLTANSAVSIWFLKSIDGTNYEDGGAAVIPARQPDALIVVRGVSTAQRTPTAVVQVPPGTWYVLVSQNTGQTWAASGNTLKIRPSTYQSQ